MLGAIVGAVVAASMPEIIGNAAMGVMGGISTYMEGQMELKEVDNKMKRMEINNRLISEHPNDYIQMRTTNAGFVNQNYADVIRNLAGMGFYDINLNAMLIRKGLFEKERTGLVANVSINGASNFDEIAVFPRDAHVVVNAIIHRNEDRLYMPELERIRQGAVMFQRPVRRCQYCNVAISDGQKFCIGCGAPV